MHCSQCKHQNNDTAKFCEECGTRLITACPQCGQQANPTAKFCGECGTALTDKAKGKSASPKPQHLAPNTQPPVSYTPPHLAERIRATSLADGERKTITALFADLKGTTALIEGLDPEEARAIIDPALQLMMDAVHRYDGYVAQALGDGIFALFGAPIAHEDHPQRALYAALRMQEEMRRYSDQVRLKGGFPLQMRVGVNTGEVVVRSIRKDDLHTDYVPVGHSTNLAARMEQMATPGSILITEYTEKLIEGYFELKSLGAAEIKGVEEPLNVYEVLGTGPLRTRLQVAVRRGLTRFVGRQSEMEQLQHALAQAKAGHGQIVGVMGEPGLGKSRLFYEFKLISQSGCLVLEAYSVSHGKASPYLPVIELLKSYCDVGVEDDERKRREKVGGKVLMLDRSLEDTLPYLFALLNIEEHPSSLQQMDPQIRRRRTFEALKKLFLRESLNQPLILIFEDLHWIDSETQGFLDVLSESVGSARLLLLTNYRPEYRHEWGQKTYYTQVRLTPFGKAEAEEFLTVLLGSDGSLTPLKRLILEKTEGTPFFIEEVVQELVERGIVVRDPRVGWVMTHPTTALHVPATVQGVLAARIDRLDSVEKELLQQLAVIGREFPLSLVRQVVHQSEDELYRVLSSLQHKEFLYEQPAFPEVEYLFKHALTQEVAYNSVLQERRKMLHERTARAVETLFHSKLEDHYSDLAHHYSRSGNTQKAIEYLHLAGQQATQRSANAEAINYLTTALDLLKTLPDTTNRAQQELMLQVALGLPLMVTKGFAAPEVEAVYARARELSQALGESPQLVSTLLGLCMFYNTKGKYHLVREIVAQLIRSSQSDHNSPVLIEAYLVLGIATFFLGEFPLAQTQFAQGWALCDSQSRTAPEFLYWKEPAIVHLSYASWLLWFLGYPDQSLAKSEEALTLARSVAHPFSLSLTLTMGGWLRQFRREALPIQAYAEPLVALSREHDFPFFLAAGVIQEGLVSAALGKGEEGVLLIHKGMTAQRATGGENGRPYFFALLAEEYGKIGRVEEGLNALADAWATIAETGECFYEAELYRLKGELILQQFKAQGSKFKVADPRSLTPDPHGEAETCFQKAIEIARRQQAKSLELRATTSLARLWQSQGKTTKAHQMLSEIYNWFTEGLDTKDLQEAEALIEELSHRAIEPLKD